ncbi:hypothetical protein PG616_08070, partial [Riemerella anatipestifer]|nr:hypothetical protein [Riemerella anatipestifer]
IFALSCSFISFYSKNNILIFSLINNSCFFHFIMHNGLTFNSDWKVDYDDLSQFISEEIQQEFTIKDKEMWQIAEKIEKESDFTMLNIDTQMDSYSLFICEKSEKERILEIARKLDFPIEAHF